MLPCNERVTFCLIESWEPSLIIFLRKGMELTDWNLVTLNKTVHSHNHKNKLIFTNTITNTKLEFYQDREKSRSIQSLSLIHEKLYLYYLLYILP